MFQLGRFRLDLISDGFFEDDADSFVKDCIEKQAAPRIRVRGKPRMRVGFNALLIRGNGQTVVVDPGTGDKPRLEKAAQYHLEWPRRFFPTLHSMGVMAEAVDAVILTHLHWDHAGAATRRAANGRVMPAFARARYFVQESELEAARTAKRNGDDSYNADDFEPLAETGCLQTINGEGEIVPGITVRWVGGHCRGLQIAVISSEGQRAVFLSDFIPTTTQLPLDCRLSYDEDPVQLRHAKETILADAVKQGDLLLFVHAPRIRAGYLKPHSAGKPRFESIEI